tara:strand:- start:5083 stop:6138 length:1056 start_codon:yes stop_codon:yes gene_type:complete
MNKNIGPLIINVDSTSLSNNESKLLCSHLIGGVLLFEHNYSDLQQIQSLIKSIKDINENLLIAIDHEGGMVQRFKDNFTLLPSFESIGAVFNKNKLLAEKIAYSSGYVAGFELKKIGIDINFSPVIDLSTSSKVLNGRTFSSSPDVVTRLASQYIQALIDNGIVPTLKHFPGHGCVLSDTHTDISESNLSYEELNVHIDTFKKLHSKFNIPIMTSHIQFNNIAKDPVTTSSDWLIDISKKIFHSKPFFISDDLEMSSISDRYNLSKINILKKSLISGCNMSIVTTMQNKEIIYKKESYSFYQKQYIDMLSELDDIILNSINLPCSDNLTYNEGNMKSYTEAINCLKEYNKF